MGLLYFCMIRAPWRRRTINLCGIFGTYKSSIRFLPTYKHSFWIYIQVVNGKVTTRTLWEKRQSGVLNEVAPSLEVLYSSKYFLTQTSELLSQTPSCLQPLSALSIPGLLQLVNVARQAHLDLLRSAFRGSPNIQSQSAAMKNPPRHNLESRKTEEAAPPEENSPLTDAIAARRARPRRKKMHHWRYNWRHYTWKTRSWNMTNASKKVAGCPGGSLYFILPPSKKVSGRGNEWSQPPLLFIMAAPFTSIRYFLPAQESPLFYSLRVREQPGNLHKWLVLTASPHSFSIFYYLCLFFSFFSALMNYFLNGSEQRIKSHY